MKALISIGAVLMGIILGFASVWVFHVWGDRRSLARTLARHAAGGGGSVDDANADSDHCSAAVGVDSD